MFNKVIGHTSFLGHTGYAHHAREFFTQLNKYIPCRIRNFAHTSDTSYLTEEQNNMLMYQEWSEPPFHAGTRTDLNPDNKDYVQLILNETNHYYFYDNYTGPKVAYNVWESTLQPEQYFKRILDFDQFWVPTQWQKDVTIAQGYPADKIFVIPEGVDGNRFCPGEPKVDIEEYHDGRFKFLLIGRWDFRKCTTEILKAFVEEFSPDEPVDMIAFVDNPFPVDKLKSTEERLAHYGLLDSRIKILKDLNKVENDDLYVSYLRNGHVFVSCARSEGWNLPLIQALACGTVSICSDYGAQLEFAEGIAHKVKIKGLEPVRNMFMQDAAVGDWALPDFEDLKKVMRDCYNNYEEYKKESLKKSELVRKKFTWDNAAKLAISALEKLYEKKSIKKREPIKLDIGSGEYSRKREGYTTVDKYYPSDLQMDAMDLGFKNRSVEEIYSSHLLEHFNKFDVELALKEWYRVLSANGKIEINVPNLEWCLKNWLDMKEDNPDKWRLPLDFIFGMSIGEGQNHKTGFTKSRLRYLLEKTGFENITIDDVWSHSQQCFLAKATKPIIDNRTVFIIDSYADTDSKINQLSSQIDKIKKYNVPVLIVTHYPVPEEISKKVDYIIYEKNNEMSKGWTLNWWFTIPKFLKIVSKYENEYHSVAILSSLKNALDFCKDKFDRAHFVEFDADFDLDEYIKKADDVLVDKKFYGFNYDEEQNMMDLENVHRKVGIVTNLFSFDIQWLDKNLDRINTWEEYANLSDQYSAMTWGHGSDYVFENWLKFYFYYKNIIDDCFFEDAEGKKSIIKNRNLFDQGKKEPKIKTLLSEFDNKKEVVLFIINNSKDSSKFRINEGDWKELHAKQVYYITYKKENMTLKLDLEDEIREIKIESSKTYDVTTFKFFDKRFKCIKWENEYNQGFITDEEDVEFRHNFIDGAFFEIIGVGTKLYTVDFIDRETNEIVYKTGLSPNHWGKPARRYFTDWEINCDGKSWKYDAKDKRVFISMDSKAMGDNIAWMPYLEEFRKKHNCNLIAATFWNDLFTSVYPDIKFVPVGTTVEDLYAHYPVGCRDNDDNRNKNNWRDITLQQVSTDYLGLDYKEIRPKINVPNLDKEISGKYVCITQHSTFHCKYWLYKNGWQTIVDYLRKRGYSTVVLSTKSPVDVTNVIDKTNISIHRTINIIKDSEMFIGISTGPTWLAWAMNIPTVLISGYSARWGEMQDCYRVINEDVCHGCFNDSKEPFDRGDWYWCPRKQDFICSKSITPNMVIKEIDKIIETRG
jgi:autotransporter strand-loop-strand O-heptosyltransferase